VQSAFCSKSALLALSYVELIVEAGVAGVLMLALMLMPSSEQRVESWPRS
jgi:hypothetical protein